MMQIESQSAALFLLVWIKVVNPIQKLKTGYSFVHGGWFKVDVHLSEWERESNMVICRVPRLQVESNITPFVHHINVKRFYSLLVLFPNKFLEV